MITLKTILFVFLLRSVSSYSYGLNITEFKINYLKIVKGLSVRCSSELKHVIENGQTLFRLFDASAKIPDGLINGRMMHLGDYDSCMATRLKVENQTIFGKYCLGSLPLKSPYLTKLRKETIQRVHGGLRNGNTESLIGLYMAICVPSGCTREDLKLINPIFDYYDELCYSDDIKPKLTTGAIIAIVILAIFIALASVSTIYDCYLYYSDKKTSDELYMSFSFLTNGKKLFTHSKNPDQLLCLNGVRAISMIWVVYGHNLANKISGLTPVSNYAIVEEYMQDIGVMYVMGSTVSVDTFFLIGGLVTVYTFLKAMDKGVKFNLPMYYIHRYLRLTPAFAAMILLQSNLATYVSDGPTWGFLEPVAVGQCRETWWKSLLYIQNYFKDTTYCVGQSWYLYVDMQLFLLSPLFLLPLQKWRKPTLIAMGVASVAGVIVPFILTLKFNLTSMLGMTLEPITNYFVDDVYYTQTFARFGPYVLGMLFGYYIYQVRNANLKLRLTKIQTLCLWMITIIILVVCLYAGHSVMTATTYDKWSNAFYIGFNRSAWSIGVGVVITLCAAGYGSFINDFLSLPVFQFLTKISYSIYLTHFAIIMCIDAASKVVIHFTHVELMIQFWSVFMTTVGVSIIFCLLFESPVVIIEKKLLTGHGKREKNQVTA